MKQDSIRVGIITLAVAVFLFGLVAMVKEADTPKCMETGCDNEPASGSDYCYLHKPYPSTIWGSTRDSGHSSTLSSTGSSASSSTPSGTGSSTSSSTSSNSTSSKSTVTNRNTTSGSKTSKKSSTSSYDEGYDDIYENEDYDMDRYYEDDDYASGVDDAMEDEDW